MIITKQITSVDTYEHLCARSRYQAQRHVIACRVTHRLIRASVNYTIFGPDKGLSPIRCQALIWSNTAVLLIEPLGTNYDVIWTKIQYSFKMATILYRPQCAKQRSVSILTTFETFWFMVDNLSPSDSKIACLQCAWASKLTTTNMYIARARCESQMAEGSSGLNACWSYGRAIEFKFLAWSSIAQSVYQRASSLQEIWFQRPWFESCIQQRKTTCPLSILKSLACARESKLTTTNMYIIHAQPRTIASIQMLPGQQVLDM